MAKETTIQKNKLYIIFLILTLKISFSFFVAGCTTIKENKKEISEIISIIPEDIYKIIKNGEPYIILDIRTKGEYDKCHLEGAIVISVLELKKK